MGNLRFGLVGNFQAGKSTLINCLIGRAIATIGDGTSTTHAVVNYLYDSKERIEYIDNNDILCIIDNMALGKIDSTQNINEINVYLDIPFLKGIVLTDMPGFGKDKHDNLLSEKTLAEIDYAIVVETNYKAIEENSDSYKNIERLKWYNVPYYIILNCAEPSKKDWKWTPLFKNNLEIASKNIQQLEFYKPLCHPFEDGEHVVVNLLWYWYSISGDDDDVIIQYQENLKNYNDLTKYKKEEIYKFSNFEVINKIFSMDNRVYLELRKDLKEEIKRLKEELCPIGTIQAFAFESIPHGWLICDGHPFRIDEYPELYKAIGYTFGGEGTEKFKVPDLRSKFVRGWDKRTRKIGSDEDDALQGHGHTCIYKKEVSEEGAHSHYTYYKDHSISYGTNTFSDDKTSHFMDIISPQEWNDKWNSNYEWKKKYHSDLYTIGNISGSQGGKHSHQLPDILIEDPRNSKKGGAIRVATETRPKNIALMYCIKAKP